MSNIYNQNEKNSANYQPLTPITFLERAASVYPERVASFMENKNTIILSFTDGVGN